MKKYGFTFIELLVVIVIITNVVAILSPVVNKARVNAQQAACLSNCKQLGKALMMYADDYERFPLSYNDTKDTSKIPDSGWWSSPGMWHWGQFVYPYTKNNNILICPSGVKIDDVGRYIKGNYGANKYALSAPLTQEQDPVGRRKSYNPSEMNDLSATYLFMDAGTYVISPYNSCWCSDSKAPSSNYYLPGIGGLGVKEKTSAPITPLFKDDFMSGRHSGNVNVGYCDGHAKFTKVEEISKEALKACKNDQNSTRLVNAWQNY